MWLVECIGVKYIRDKSKVHLIAFLMDLKINWKSKKIPFMCYEQINSFAQSNQEYSENSMRSFNDDDEHVR